MGTNCCTAWKMCIPSCARSRAGLTLVELLVAMAVTLVMMGAALSITLSSKRIYATDRTRTDLNQNLRNGLDLVGLDVRQAGERLPLDIPVIQILDGASGGSDTLILRRNLLDPVLPLCKDINANTNADSIFVAKKNGNVPPGCAPVPDDDGDGWPENLQAWKDYRVGGGGEVWAYIYDPVRGAGEFFLYDAEDNSTFHLHKSNAVKWQNNYDTANLSRIYILEQRTYSRNGDLLEYLENGDTLTPVNLVPRVNDFQARAFLQDGTVRNSFGGGDDWSALQSVEITLSCRSTVDGRTMTRAMTTRYFPRNVLSR